jgi:hypothetical protein
MSWIAAATLTSAAIGANASSKASKGQQKSADAATAEQARQYDLTREDQAPYQEAGVEALQRLRGFVDPSMEHYDVQNEPGYQFGLSEGMNALQNTAAARGGLYSGAAMKGLTRYANDYASTKYGDAWNRMQTDAGNRWGRMAGLAGIGQSATNQVGAAGANYANAMGNIGMSNANAQGAAGMQRANIWGNALGQLGSMAGRSGGMDRAQAWFSRTPLGGSGFGTGLAYGNDDLGNYI